MSENSEALNSILNRLKRLEIQLKPLTSQLQKILLSSTLSMEESRILEDIRRHLSNMEGELSKILGFNPSLPDQQQPKGVMEGYIRGPPVIIRCKNWEDFRSQAAGCEAASFLYKAEDKTFQVDALKNGRVYTFSGPVPSDVTLLKAWLVRTLNIEESKVMEGVLAIG